MVIEWSEIERQLPTLNPTSGGFSPAKRGLVTLSDGRTVFVKLGTDEYSRRMAKQEIISYQILEKYSLEYLPKLLSHNDTSDGFATEALTVDGGWDWSSDWNKARLEATLRARNRLAEITPNDHEERGLLTTHPFEQSDNGWVPLRDSGDKRDILKKKLESKGILDLFDSLNFELEAQKSLSFKFADNQLVHYDLRSDNCPWNEKIGEVRFIDINYLAFGDTDIDLASLITHVVLSGYTPDADILNSLNPHALHWLAGFWLYAATRPVWDSGTALLRDAQLQSGVRALELSNYNPKVHFNEP